MASILGKCKNNKWSCFCVHWANPTQKALTPAPGRNLYIVDNTACYKCNKHVYKTMALANCKDFTPKF